MRMALVVLAGALAASGVTCALGGEDNTTVYSAVGGAVSSTGAAGGGGDTTGPAGCFTDADCLSSLPQTSPPDCAVPWCDAVLGMCRFLTKDEDGDGHMNANCFVVGGGDIELGDDCDDANPQRFPGSWDGPIGDGHSSSGCGDSTDNDCNGVVDDQKLQDGTTCICSPSQQQDCSEYPNGVPISWPGGSPLTPCQYGTQTCGADGQWGPCLGAVAPETEVCDEFDNDCDGQTNEGINWMGILVGQSCHLGLGACYRTGTVACFVGGGANCNAAIISAQGWKYNVDPLTNSWDWDCNGVVDYRDPLDKIVASCDFGFQDACSAVFSNAAECIGEKVIGCLGGCGQPILKVNCDWVTTPGGGHACKHVTNPSSSTQACK